MVVRAYERARKRLKNDPILGQHVKTAEVFQKGILRRFFKCFKTENVGFSPLYNVREICNP